jgi:RNA polymerase sigma-70 factor (ECF subfamily)
MIRNRRCLQRSVWIGKHWFLYNETKGFILDCKYHRNTSIDKLRSKGYNNKQKPKCNIHILLDDSNKLFEFGTIGIQDFV